MFVSVIYDLQLRICLLHVGYRSLASEIKSNTHNNSNHNVTDANLKNTKDINLLALELFLLILAHSVYKTWIIQEPNKLDLWNKLHFEEEKTESIYYV